MKTNWKWLTQEIVLAIHDQQIADHGGTDGRLDMGLNESDLARVRNLAEKLMLGHPLYIILQGEIYLRVNQGLRCAC